MFQFFYQFVNLVIQLGQKLLSFISTLNLSVEFQVEEQLFLELDSFFCFSFHAFSFLTLQR